MIRSLTFLLVFLPSMAWSAHPQFFFQADENQHIITPGVSLLYSESKFANNAPTDFHGSFFRFSYEYGLLENFSLSAILTYTYIRFRSGSRHATTSGPSNPSLEAKGFYSLGNFTLRYGSFLTWSPENDKPDNAYTGSNFLTPYAGFNYNLGSSTVGARVSRQVLIGKRKDENTSGQVTESTGGEGSTFSVFYEYFFGKSLVGANVFHRHTDDIVYPNGTRGAFRDGTGFNLYASLFLNKKITLLPIIGYSTSFERDIGIIRLEKDNDYSAGLSVRFTMN